MRIQDWMGSAYTGLEKAGWTCRTCGKGAYAHNLYHDPRVPGELAAICRYKPGSGELHACFKQVAKLDFVNAGIAASGRTPVPGLNTALTEHVRKLVTDELSAAHQAELAELSKEFEAQAKELAARAELAETECVAAQNKADAALARLRKAERAFHELAESFGVDIEKAGGLDAALKQVRLRAEHLKKELDDTREGRFRALPGMPASGKPRLRVVGSPPPVPASAAKSTNR